MLSDVRIQGGSCLGLGLTDITYSFHGILIYQSNLPI